MIKGKLTEFEQIMKYFERKGFKLEQVAPEVNAYFYSKGKVIVAIAGEDKNGS